MLISWFGLEKAVGIPLIKDYNRVGFFVPDGLIKRLDAQYFDHLSGSAL